MTSSFLHAQIRLKKLSYSTSLRIKVLRDGGKHWSHLKMETVRILSKYNTGLRMISFIKCTISVNTLLRLTACRTELLIKKSDNFSPPASLLLYCRQPPNHHYVIGNWSFSLVFSCTLTLRYSNYYCLYTLLYN